MAESFSYNTQLLETASHETDYVFRKSQVQQEPAEPATPPPPSSHGHGDVIDVNLIKSPKQIYDYLVDVGATKGDTMPMIRQAFLAVLAGCYLGLGFSCCMICGGQMANIKKNDPGLQSLLYGIYGFPVGLVLILICGGDLFTSNCCYMLAALCEGRTSIFKLIRIWLISYFCNLAGCIFMAQLFAWSTTFDGKEAWPIAVTKSKVSHTFGQTVVKGILANWMVNLAVVLASGSRDLCGKVLGVIMPISAFVSMGFEHCIANQFVFPLAMFLGSGMSVSTFITKNLIPATIGNVIGGGIFVGVFYALIFGQAGRALEKWENKGLAYCSIKVANVTNGRSKQVKEAEMRTMKA